MTINKQFSIAPNLQCGVMVDDYWITIEYENRRQMDGRTQYRWTIFNRDQNFTGNDLRSGVQGGDIAEGMSSLLVFLSAFAEAQRYPNSESRDIFPVGLAEWAQRNGDEFSMLSMEIEESNLIVE